MGDSGPPASVHPLAQRPTYTREQLSQYVTRVFPPSYTLERLEADVKTNPLDTLTRLQLRQLARVPWGNIAMHYSMHKALSLDNDALFTKIVERGLGGYCMENNMFFATVLRSLGYQLYAGGARVSNAIGISGKHPDGFGGWEHMILLVTIDGRVYNVDVGFGSQGAVSPLQLEEGMTSSGVPGNMCRLVKRAIAQNISGQKMWILETMNDTSDEWKPGYCFSELEFLPEDFKNLNYRTHRDPTSWFTYTLTVTRVLLEGEEDPGGYGIGEKAVGTVTLVNGSISKRIARGQRETVQEFKTEEERVKALRTWFGVKLREEEMKGVLGMATEIRRQMTDI